MEAPQSVNRKQFIFLLIQFMMENRIQKEWFEKSKASSIIILFHEFESAPIYILLLIFEASNLAIQKPCKSTPPLV